MADQSAHPSPVLIIDDDEHTRETYQHMLRADGYAVRSAPTVEAGLAEAGRERPAAVLLDLHMPLAGGLDCLRRLRAEPHLASIPVAIVTGDYFLDDRVAGELLALGARIHFKPLWQDDLQRLVKELLAE